MITFNGVSSTAYSDIISVQNVARPLAPGSRAQVLDIVGRDGSYYFGKDRRSQTISFRLVLNSTAISDRRAAIRQIAGWLDTDEQKILSFTDESDLIYYAVLSEAIPVDEFATVGFADVSFFIPDGCAYSSSITEVSSTGTYTTFNNQGTLDANVVMEATLNEASTEDFKLSLTDETYITVEPSTAGFSISDEVIVDTATRAVTLNDVDVQDKVTIDSTFFKLPVGVGKVTPDPASSSLTLKFRQRFI